MDVQCVIVSSVITGLGRHCALFKSLSGEKKSLGRLILKFTDLFIYFRLHALHHP